MLLILLLLIFPTGIRLVPNAHSIAYQCVLCYILWAHPMHTHSGTFFCLSTQQLIEFFVPVPDQTVLFMVFWCPYPILRGLSVFVYPIGPIVGNTIIYCIYGRASFISSFRRWHLCEAKKFNFLPFEFWWGRYHFV